MAGTGRNNHHNRTLQILGVRHFALCHTTARQTEAEISVALFSTTKLFFVQIGSRFFQISILSLSVVNCFLCWALLQARCATQTAKLFLRRILRGRPGFNCMEINIPEKR